MSVRVRVRVQEPVQELGQELPWAQAQASAWERVPELGQALASPGQLRRHSLEPQSRASRRSYASTVPESRFSRRYRPSCASC